MDCGWEAQIARYTGDIHVMHYNRVGKISKARGHDDPRSLEVGLWVFLPSGDDLEPVLVRRRDWEEALH